MKTHLPDPSALLSWTFNSRVSPTAEAKAP
jgi:hypothetical protein